MSQVKYLADTINYHVRSSATKPLMAASDLCERAWVETEHNVV